MLGQLSGTLGEEAAAAGAVGGGRGSDEQEGGQPLERLFVSPGESALHPACGRGAALLEDAVEQLALVTAGPVQAAPAQARGGGRIHRRTRVPRAPEHVTR